MLFRSPGVYYVRLKFAETRGANASGYTRKTDPNLCAVTVYINGREVVTDLDIVVTANKSGKAGGVFGEAVDLVFNDIYPQNGIIEIRFKLNSKLTTKLESGLRADYACCDTSVRIRCKCVILCRMSLCAV